MKSQIIIDIYSDTICPWCYIGFKKLKKAIEYFPTANFDILWRPFQLNPDMPKEGMNRKKYLKIKFGEYENVNRIYKSIYEAGLKNNIYFQLDKISITPNSFVSHKLLALANISKKQNEIIETLFYAYFIEGKDIGDIKELITIAKLNKIYDKNTLEYLTSAKDNESLLEEGKHAKELGINGVPCFIINKEFVLFGAQEKSKFIDIFSKLLK